MRYKYRDHHRRWNSVEPILSPQERIVSHCIIGSEGFYPPSELYLIEKAIPFRSRIRTKNTKNT